MFVSPSYHFALHQHYYVSVAASLDISHPESGRICLVRAPGRAFYRLCVTNCVYRVARHWQPDVGTIKCQQVHWNQMVSRVQIRVCVVSHTWPYLCLEVNVAKLYRHLHAQQTQQRLHRERLQRRWLCGFHTRTHTHNHLALMQTKPNSSLEFCILSSFDGTAAAGHPDTLGCQHLPDEMCIRSLANDIYFSDLFRCACACVCVCARWCVDQSVWRLLS